MARRTDDRHGHGDQAVWDAQEVRSVVAADGRRIQLTGMANLRDVGGYPLVGGVVRWRTLYRSDAPYQLDGQDLAALAGLNLRTVVDLRTQVEAEMAPSELGGLAARTMHVSVLGTDLEGLPLELDALYEYMIEERGDAIVTAIRALCADDALPALVHCSAGKDRTGVVIALILAVLGVPDELIAADYALSANYLDPDRTPVIGQLGEIAGLDEELIAELMVSPPELIGQVLERISAGAGSAERYLLDRGLSRVDLEKLRAALIA